MHVRNTKREPGGSRADVLLQCLQIHYRPDLDLALVIDDIAIQIVPPRAPAPLAIRPAELRRGKLPVNAECLLMREHVVPQKTARSERQRVVARVWVTPRPAAERFLKII